MSCHSNEVDGWVVMTMEHYYMSSSISFMLLYIFQHPCKNQYFKHYIMCKCKYVFRLFICCCHIQLYMCKVFSYLHMCICTFVYFCCICTCVNSCLFVQVCPFQFHVCMYAFRLIFTWVYFIPSCTYGHFCSLCSGDTICPLLCCFFRRNINASVHTRSS